MKLTDRPTPETDAAEWRRAKTPTGFVHRSICARIEQQRDCAVEALMFIAEGDQPRAFMMQRAIEALAEIEESKHD